MGPARERRAFFVAEGKEWQGRTSRSGLPNESAAMTSAIWTPENTQRLISLWKEGRTAAWIARALGPGVSRCAVLGKVYRLGLARGPEGRRVCAATPPGVKRPRQDASVARSALRPSGPSRGKTAITPSTAAIATPPSPTATILSVGLGQCRWPYGSPGEAGFGLCGRPAARGAFYAAHAEVGYRKSTCTAESLLRMVGVV
jgi:GcrA cell cycle regulator